MPRRSEPRQIRPRDGVDSSLAEGQERHPIRTCVGCRCRGLKADLLRVVAIEDVCVPDPRGRLAGRGAYLHPDLECLALAERRRALPRALRVPGLVLDPLRDWLAEAGQQDRPPAAPNESGAPG